MYCLPRNMVHTFLEKLKSGEIDPEKLTDMTSQERRGYFADFLGETNAREVNALFESKLLLKNQQQGIINWAKQVTGMKPEIKRDILSRVNKMTEVLEPKTADAFLEDLAAHRLGVTVTMEEAGKIAELAKVISEKKNAMNVGGDRLEYGRARVAFGNYISELKTSKMSALDYLHNPVRMLSDVAGVAKSLKASLDDSAIFRQGWKTLWTNPGIWMKNAVKSFSDIIRTIGHKPVMDELNADIVSRPTYDLMVKARLAVGTIEEAYPAHLKILNKVPVAGELYRASENAFTAFVYRQRADIFDKYIDMARRTDVDLGRKVEIESIGKLVNSLTGRGNIGRLEPVANVVNNVFFSPRLIKSHIDTLLLHPIDRMTMFTRTQAVINLVKIVSGTAMVLVVADAIMPGSVEKDTRSSDFGKIKVGHTRFDMTGGMGGLVTLAARLGSAIAGKPAVKSSITHKIMKLNTGEYGAETGMDVIYNFFENKLSPAASVLKDIMNGEDFQGNKLTFTGELVNLFIPLPITTYAELVKDPYAADTLLSMIADALGIATNTYSKRKK